MKSTTDQQATNIHYPEIDYPESDGQPMAETDFQRVYIVYATEVLDIYFQNRPNIYVSGNICFYYEEENPRAYLAPDVFVVLGLEKRKRRTYKVWQEGGKFPDFVLEITSKSTVNEDQGSKKGLYAFWGVQEYFQYDPTGDYLNPQLQGLTLVDGNYVPISASRSERGELRLRSQTLGLDLRLDNQELRFYDPATNERLMSHKESELARQQAQLRAEQEMLRAEREALRAERLAAKLRELGVDPDDA